MSYFQYRPRETFPFSDLPRTLEQYYRRLRFAKRRENKDIFESVESVNAALKSDEDFIVFWNRNCEGKPEIERYLSGSKMLSDWQYVDQISRRYQDFLRWRKLSDISTSARNKIKSEFNAIRSTLHRGLLEEEAARLNCDVSEVRPIVPVLPPKAAEEQSKMCSLPDDVFAKIMACLQAIEIFRMTLVCKSWRQSVYRKAFLLRRAEHSLTTHLLAFTKWMNRANVVSGSDFRMHYQSFGWSLMKWCSNVSLNLETVVLHEFNCPYGEVVELLRQCPNLKHLHCRFSDPALETGTNIMLPNLETLIIEDSHFMSASKFAVEVFATSHDLRVFKGKLEKGDITNIIEKKLNVNAFSNLIALQLISFSAGLMELLATLDQVQLRYLYLGDSFTLNRRQLRPYQGMIDEERNAFHVLLLKQNQLEVLVSLWDLDLDGRTIKIMTQEQQNLKSAMIRFHATSLDNVEAFVSINGEYEFDELDALISFEEMLLDKDPTRDLLAFEFVVEDWIAKEFLQDAETGFSIHEMQNVSRSSLEKLGLSHPTMRRQLGINT